MKEADEDETDTKVLYAPTTFYDACDDCDSLPEERWEEFRHKLEEEKKTIVEGRERVLFFFQKFLIEDSSIFYSFSNKFYSFI